MNEVIVYAKVNNEKALIGTFESTENIYDEVEARLDSLNLSYMMERRYYIYVRTSFDDYRMIWGEKNMQKNESQIGE
ncbi:hypothetical protein A5886_002189 [Enterococcus sp. 8G7_MSG3316]|uniref:Uncharacterized protein n=1 Tax=Candidatus Enterococcus testudinis TaxID=1834191 RepID=A0A242A859_9ENTE|nr:hypothetical protein [Enterococcus sp. 8G7_MSG3316]OTN77109.1 hypothetical protein A5886_002189 [Enterococcus sp. 8G7_MSG3316]